MAFAPTPEPGDANGDGQVDINDLTIVLTNYGQIAGMAWSQGDFTGDGAVDMDDLTIVLANFGETSSAGLAAVPEPAGLVLLGIGAIGLLGYGWRRRRLRQLASAIAVVLILTASVAHAQVSNVFNMSNGEVSLQFVTVGDPNNPPDTGGTVGDGSVDYVYQMNKYDVTVGQYCLFLNAVAGTDTYGLYNSNMAVGGDFIYFPTVGITRTGKAGSYTYSVSYTASAWSSYVAYDPALYPTALAAAADCPIAFVTWGDAARFANWLQNGQPTNLGEAAGSTETGAYTLNGDTTSFLTETRNAGAKYFIPSENEWYKAAYFNPSSSTYWTYPTQSNATPSNVLSVTGTNDANYYVTGYTDPTNYLTPVGAFAGSPAPFGTYDMGGELWQWDEANIISNGVNLRGLRGGYWDSNSNSLESSYRIGGNPTEDGLDIGFRVASIPKFGDANGDGTVDINDLTIVLANFGQTGMTWSQGEFTGSGTVDINDLTIVLANYNTSVGSSLSAVPEPSCFVLLSIAVISLLALASRKRRPA